ncbi:MAG: zinc ABC transporter substrate-binding protein [Candidatus Omnitrophica bacterium]|nr:zinc ABC transporter substrate-binding protein [Candidatus Omnitrophota bacterium]
MAILWVALSLITQPPVFGDDFKIAATIFPVADIAKHITGETAEVLTLLPSGADPHIFELTPQLIKRISGAALILMIGHGFDDWVKAAGESVPGARIVRVDEGIDLIGTEDGEDPHYWLSFRNARIIAKNLTHLISELDPNHESQYQANLEVYLEALREADEAAKAMLANLKIHEIVTFHNGWQYFAKDFGLKILAVVEASHGEPTARHLVRLTETVSRNRVQALFIQPAVSRSVANSLAHDLNLRLYQLDPLGSNQHPDYIHLMLANVRVVQEALGNE